MITVLAKNALIKASQRYDVFLDTWGHPPYTPYPKKEVLIINNGGFQQVHIPPIYLPLLRERREDIPLLVDTLYPSIEH